MLSNKIEEINSLTEKMLNYIGEWHTYTGFDPNMAKMAKWFFLG